MFLSKQEAEIMASRTKKEYLIIKKKKASEIFHYFIVVFTYNFIFLKLMFFNLSTLFLYDFFTLLIREIFARSYFYGSRS